MVQLCLSQNGPTLSQNGTGVTKWYSFVTKWYRCHKMVQFSQNGPQQLLVPKMIIKATTVGQVST